MHGQGRGVDVGGHMYMSVAIAAQDDVDRCFKCEELSFQHRQLIDRTG